MEKYTTVKARLLINLYMKINKCNLTVAKEHATDYCDTIIADIELLGDNNEKVISFYLLVIHEINKIDTHF